MRVKKMKDRKRNWFSLLHNLRKGEKRLSTDYSLLPLAWDVWTAFMFFLLLKWLDKEERERERLPSVKSTLSSGGFSSFWYISFLSFHFVYSFCSFYFLNTTATVNISLISLSLSFSHIYLRRTWTVWVWYRHGIYQRSDGRKKNVKNVRMMWKWKKQKDS